MIKQFRRPLALALALAMSGAASTALAASKKVSDTFTKVPTLKLTDVPSVGTESGGMNTIDINASLPGFLDLVLLDASGRTVLTIADNKEIHSNTTTFDFYAVDDEGEPLPVGVYTVSASMVSQYGVESKPVSKDTNILESTDKDVAAQAAKKGAVKGTTAAKTETAASTGSTGNKTTTSSKTAAPKATATPKPSEKITYAEGTYTMGDEGLMIGVGVSDMASTSSGYWNLTADATDAELWAAITRPMTGVDVGESESAYIYNSPEKGREKIGTVSGISQGLNLIAERDDGWALVEAFRNEDGAFIRGYIKADKLRTSEPNTLYGIVIDKATQTLTVYKEGTRLGSCQVTTGLPTPKYPHRETPAGEFILVTRRGSYEYYGQGFTKYTIRVNNNYYLAEVPTTKKNGTKFMDVADSLGTKATRGTICVAHDASTDGGINAEWIWDMTDGNKRVKVLIFDDKPRTDVPVSSK